MPRYIKKTKDKLTNYGTYIAGFGTERVNSDAPSHPLFQAPINPGEIPFDLKAAGYDGTSVKYNPTTGIVTCYFQSSLGFDSFSFLFSSVIILVTGTIFAMWLGEKITDKGIGNGISLLIMVTSSNM